MVVALNLSRERRREIEEEMGVLMEGRGKRQTP
jgi:hypothetical protein